MGRSYRVVEEEKRSVLPYRITETRGTSGIWENSGRYSLDGVKVFLLAKGANDGSVMMALNELRTAGRTIVVQNG